MKITKKRLFDFCNENNDALNDLQSQSDSTDFVLSTLIDQLKDLGVIDKLGDEPSEPKLKQLDQSVFDGLDERWVAASVEENGIVRLYLSNENNPYDCEYHLAGTKYDPTNWQNSLIERDIAKELLEVDLSSELTGSDLCRAMLARGDKYVLCHLSQTSEKSAKDVLGIAIGHDHSGFRVQRHNSWQYAIPINNQGEPLTAAEVEL